MRSGSINIIISAAIIVAGFAAVFGLSNYLEKNRVSLPEAYADEDLTLQGKRLKGFVLGAEGLLADWYWMQSLQYIGNKLLKDESGFINLDDLRPLNPRLLYPYLDNAADLDPKFIAVYTYGATVLPAIDTRNAIALAEKGIVNNPEQWRLYQHLGYIYWRLKDYEKASEVYEKGSQITGAPRFMKMMVAVVKTQGGSRPTARAMYQQMLAEAQDQQTKSNAEFRLMELDSLDERDAIRSVLKNVKETTGRCPSSLNEIKPLLHSVKLPAGNDFEVNNAGDLSDPTGVPYVLDNAACDVKLDEQNSRLPFM